MLGYFDKIEVGKFCCGCNVLFPACLAGFYKTVAKFNLIYVSYNLALVRILIHTNKGVGQPVLPTGK